MTDRVSPWLVLVPVCLARVVAVLDAAIVNVALHPEVPLDRRPTTAAVPASAPGKPTGAETARAPVDGFRLAWIGCAAVLAAGARFLLRLLRRGEEVAAARGEADPVVA